MFACHKCHKTLSDRKGFILHSSVCGYVSPKPLRTSRKMSNFLNNMFAPLALMDEEEDSPADDSDADPHFEPSASSEDSYSLTSSPITQEQREAAEEAEELLIDLSPIPQEQRNIVEEHLFDLSPITQEQRDTAEEHLFDLSPITHEQREADEEAEELLIDSSLGVQLSSLRTDKNQEVDTNVLANDDKRARLKQKLKEVQQRIKLWKEKRRQAFSEGKKSTAKRISKCIRKCDEEMKEYNNNNFNEDPSEIVESNETVSKNVEMSKNKRKLNFCFYCNVLVSKFSEHIQRKHKETPEGIKLSAVTGTSGEKRIEKMKITNSLRKEWNAKYNNQLSNITSAIPVKKRHGGKPVGSIQCAHCNGYYRRDKLSVHLRRCTEFLMKKNDAKNPKSTCKPGILVEIEPNIKPQEKSEVQVPLTNLKPICKPTPAIKSNSKVTLQKNLCSLVTEEFKKEILKGLHIDEISKEIVNDAILLKYGSEFHYSRRENSSKDYVIRVLRDLGKVKISMMSKINTIKCFEDCFNPKHFNTLIEVALEMAGYDKTTGLTKTPSVAYRLSPFLREAAVMIRSIRQTALYESNSCDRSGMTMIDDFLKSMEHEWKKKIGRICIKSQKIARVDREEKVALEEDIVKLASFIEGCYRKTIEQLKNSDDKSPIFDSLMQMLVTHIMLLIRRRPVDFKNAKLRHLNNIDKHDELISMAADKELNDIDMDVCKKFHLFYVPGKNFNIVPMVLTPLMKNVMDVLNSYREEVSITCDTLFVLSENKDIKPNQSIRSLAKKVNLKKPSHMTGNGLRHQAATFSRMHSKHPQYQDYLASVLGHNLFTHKKHYELPLSITQKLMVCPILHNIMMGKKGKKQNLSTVTINDEESPSKLQGVNNFNPLPSGSQTLMEIDTPIENESPEKYNCPFKRQAKVRWTEMEQNTVLSHFAKEILNKELVKRGAVVKFLKQKGHLLKNRSVSQVYLFIRNHTTRKQCNVTPKVKRALVLD